MRNTIAIPDTTDEVYAVYNRQIQEFLKTAISENMRTLLTQVAQTVLSNKSKTTDTFNADALEEIRKKLLAALDDDANDHIQIINNDPSYARTLKSFIEGLLFFMAQIFPMNEECIKTRLLIDPISRDTISPNDQFYTFCGRVFDVNILLEWYLHSCEGYQVDSQNGLLIIKENISINNPMTNTPFSPREISALIVCATRVGILDHKCRYHPKTESAKKHLKELQNQILQARPKPFVLQTFFTATALIALCCGATHNKISDLKNMQILENPSTAIAHLSLILSNMLSLSFVAYVILPVTWRNGIKNTVWDAIMQHPRQPPEVRAEMAARW